MGQSRHFGRRPFTSALSPSTDIVTAGWHVSNVPNSGHTRATATCSGLRTSFSHSASFVSIICDRRLIAKRRSRIFFFQATAIAKSRAAVPFTSSVAPHHVRECASGWNGRGQFDTAPNRAPARPGTGVQARWTLSRRPRPFEPRPFFLSSPARLRLQFPPSILWCRSIVPLPSSMPSSCCWPPTTFKSAALYCGYRLDAWP